MIPTETIDQSQNRSARGAPAEFTALDFLIILARRKRLILWFTLGAAVLAAIVSLLIPNRYTAATVVLPPSQSSSVSSALLSQLGGAAGGAGALASLAGGSLGIKNPGEMYVSFFRSRTVEDSVIQRFGLMGRYRKKNMSDARKAFEKHSSVVLGVKDGLIRVGVEDWDPKLAAEIANGYVDEFRKLSATLAITEAAQRRLFFEQQLLEARGNLTAAEEAMKSTEQSTGVLQIDSQARALIESAASLRGQAVAKQVQIQAMRTFASEDNPDLIVAKRQLAELQAQLNKLAGQESDQFIVPKGKAPEAGMEYLRKLRDVKYNETIYELIAKQFELAKLDEARQGAIVQVADKAVVPDKKSYPPRTIMVLLLTFAAFGIAVVWAIVSEQWAATLRDPEKHSRIQTLRDLLFQKK
jgi:uncharacterized protein involved in exopolysaccharide biosynthesis